MKIGILTQPLYTNYGGLVQCYALQEVLRRMGHEPIVLQREFLHRYTLRGGVVYYAKHIAKLLLRKETSWHYIVDPKRREYIAKNTHLFVEKHISSRSTKCYTTEELKSEVERLKLDAIIVGSDQVWRPFFSPCQPNYFLDFLGDNSTIRRISYAASFGGDEWSFSDELTKKCGALLHRFNAVSVREKSAVGLCKTHFGVDAIQTLDPTMLLDKDDYTRIIASTERKEGLFCYILDRSNEKRDVIQQVAKTVGLKPFETMPELKDSVQNLYKNLEKCVYPPVEDWLSSFRDAEMVVTDSFHGTVFSIIFNKPFWVVGNKDRGMARFESLLSQYGLKDRLITPEALMSIDLKAPIDWQQVNEKRTLYKEESLCFIYNALQ